MNEEDAEREALGEEMQHGMQQLPGTSSSVENTLVAEYKVDHTCQLARGYAGPIGDDALKNQALVESCLQQFKSSQVRAPKIHHDRKSHVPLKKRIRASEDNSTDEIKWGQRLEDDASKPSHHELNKTLPDRSPPSINSSEFTDSCEFSDTDRKRKYQQEEKAVDSPPHSPPRCESKQERGGDAAAAAMAAVNRLSQARKKRKRMQDAIYAQDRRDREKQEEIEVRRSLLFLQQEQVALKKEQERLQNLLSLAEQLVIVCVQNPPEGQRRERSPASQGIRELDSGIPHFTHSNPSLVHQELQLPGACTGVAANVAACHTNASRTNPATSFRSTGICGNFGSFNSQERGVRDLLMHFLSNVSSSASSNISTTNQNEFVDLIQRQQMQVGGDREAWNQIARAQLLLRTSTPQHVHEQNSKSRLFSQQMDALHCVARSGHDVLRYQLLAQNPDRSENRQIRMEREHFDLLQDNASGVPGSMSPQANITNRDSSPEEVLRLLPQQQHLMQRLQSVANPLISLQVGNDQRVVSIDRSNTATNNSSTTNIRNNNSNKNNNYFHNRRR